MCHQPQHILQEKYARLMFAQVAEDVIENAAPPLAVLHTLAGALRTEGLAWKPRNEEVAVRCIELEFGRSHIVKMLLGLAVRLQPLDRADIVITCECELGLENLASGMRCSGSPLLRSKS